MAGFKSKKPKIDLSRPVSSMGSEHNREWRTVTIAELKLNDLVAGMGLVKGIFETCGENYYLIAGENTDQEFDPDMQVLAFVRKDN